MPIYEFFCPSCRVIFSFLSKRIDTRSCPPCPRCARVLSREVSLFASPRGGGGEGGGEEGSVDDARMEQAMEQMAGRIEGLDEENPRQAAETMRQFAAASGMRLNPTMEEALARMEAGEDPEAVESELGSELESADPFAADPEKGGGRGRDGGRREPERDPKLYEL